METTKIKLLLTSSPFLKQEEDTPAIMRGVIISLVPATIGAVYYFGFSALLVILISIFGALTTEYLYVRLTKKRVNSLEDNTAVLTGLLFALTLPPGIPLWIALLGIVVAIVLGKLIFGGMGTNIFNPALVGRAFLQAAFPVELTTWAPSGNWDLFSQLRGATFNLPFTHTGVAAVTSATPLSEMKFSAKLTALPDLFFGSSAGSLGETSALLLLLGGAYMLYRRYINGRIPLSIFLTVAVLTAILHWIDPLKYAPPMFHLFSGGLMLGALFMATDPVTSPITQRGCWFFGLGIGFLIVLIRTYGGLPEGVMYAILLMNGVTPLINRVTRARVYGGS